MFDLVIALRKIIRLPFWPDESSYAELGLGILSMALLSTDRAALGSTKKQVWLDLTKSAFPLSQQNKPFASQSRDTTRINSPENGTHCE
jgi:hypothetical protein